MSVTKIVHKKRRFPVIVEKDEDGFYAVECPVLRGCYTQGKTLDEALKNIREVIELCLEEKENRIFAKNYQPIEIGLHMVAV
jgi:predicted RNase H-like HicB family nuclease